ncbi:MAG: GFA family protein [Hyphomonadaceae bacterium]
MTAVSGSCHCGAVKFSVETDLGPGSSVFECNCSHCARKGLLLHFVSPDQFTLETPEAKLTEYRFNTHSIAHKFCPTCGVQGFATGKTPKTGREMVAINVRCIEGVDLDALTRQPVDGKSF